VAKPTRTRGLTIVEVMVVLGVVAVVLALTFSVFGHAQRLSRQTACLSNLRQIALGLECYYTDYARLPGDESPERLETGLLAFLKDDRVLHCPSDPNEGRSSYSPYYVKRRELGAADYMLGCPRHADGRIATVLYGSAGSEGNNVGRVTHDGAEVNVGDRVTGGVIRFADGSVAALEEDLSVSIVTSFERDDGSYYTILRVPAGQIGGIGLDVNPRSRLEVVTPAAIAGSEGTRFYVLQYEAGVVKVGEKKKKMKILQHTILYVTDGRVRLTTRGRKHRERLVVGGECVFFEHPGGELIDCVRPTKKRLPEIPGGASIEFPPR